MGRRDSNDQEWIKTKKKVRERDNETDRMSRICTAVEYNVLRKKAKFLLNTLDPAHYLPVSERPDLCYDYNNIVLLNRYSHEMLDSFKDPIYGNPISREQVREWWVRILKGNKEQYKYLEERGLI